MMFARSGNRIYCDFHYDNTIHLFFYGVDYQNKPSRFFEQGLSLLLLVCGVIAGIVIRDAIGIRGEVSRHSLALNKQLRISDFKDIGHAYWDVAVGVLLGIVMTLIAYWIF